MIEQFLLKYFNLSNLPREASTCCHYEIMPAVFQAKEMLTEIVSCIFCELLNVTRVQHYLKNQKLNLNQPNTNSVFQVLSSDCFDVCSDAHE